MKRLWQRGRHRIKTELRDLMEFVVLPGLAALLPWCWCFALYRRIAYWPWLYGASCREAWVQAQNYGLGGDDARQWMAERRLVTLLDHADHYLIRTRPHRAWMRRHLQVEGAWSHQGQAGLLWTFHWGMGMWALRHAREHGMQAPMVLAAPSGPDFAGRTVFRLYVQARMRSVAMALGEPVIFVPGGMAQVRGALAQGKQVVVVMDVPQDQVAVTRQTPLLNRPVSVPAVLPQLAVDQALPVTVYTMGVDMQTGQRVMKIMPLGVPSDAKIVTDTAFAQLDHLLRTAPASWHFWALAPRFFVAREDQRKL